MLPPRPREKAGRALSGPLGGHLVYEVHALFQARWLRSPLRLHMEGTLLPFLRKSLHFVSEETGSSSDLPHVTEQRRVPMNGYKGMSFLAWTTAHSPGQIWFLQGKVLGD